MSAPPANPRCPPSPPEEITFLTPDPFSPKPLVADILRTRYCIPGSIFLVEVVDAFRASSSSGQSRRPRSRSSRWRGVRLLLGDGELCVQALLAGDMHSYVDRGDVAVGAYVRLESFTLERTVDPENNGGGIVYLAVASLVTVGWNNRLLAMLDAEEAAQSTCRDTLGHVREADKKAHEELVETVDVAEAEPQSDPEPEPEPAQNTARPEDQPGADLEREAAEIGGEDEEDDDFEVMDVSEDRATQKRAEVALARTSSLSDYSVPVDPDQLPWSSADPTKPLKLTTLRAIPNLPYKQNWSTNILAVIASVSDVQSSPLPPFVQRVARLAHPSTHKQVHLTVFLDARDFSPRVGSVVLLLGVKNHRFDGGSLKKYASDKPRNGGRWWYEDPVQLTWCDVEGLRTWWRQSQIVGK
ncbi:hypothetical protein KJ359_002230 [Pestalotiopsis sp. 9143b]|nr:hypothetical protein KJ359_002230 [Pestalotiopsis sp. 9143b]